MNVTFDTLKTDLNSVLQEFKRALSNGDYDKAKTITKTVLQLYKDTYGIELDTDPQFNHIFHEAMLKMDNEIRSNNPVPAKTTDHIELVKTFSKVADEVFKVAEVRKRAMEMDPTAEDLIASYESGIKDAEEHKKKLLSMKKEYENIKKEIYGKDNPDLQGKIDNGKFAVGRLDTIKQKVEELNKLVLAIEKMENEIKQDPTLESRYRGNINANKNTIGQGIFTMSSMLRELEANGINVDSIKKVVSLNDTERMSVLPQVDTLRTAEDTKLTANYTELMKNLSKAKAKHPDIDTLANMDFSQMNPTTKDGRQAIEDAAKPFLKLISAIDKSIKREENHIEVYKKSIEQVKEEQKIMDIDLTDDSRYTAGMTQDVKDKIKAEEDYYRQDEKDKMYGNPEKAAKWKKYLEILKTCEKDQVFDLKDLDGNPIIENGNPKTGVYRTVDMNDFEAKLTGINPPVSVEDALKLLQLEEYQRRLERVTKIRAGDKYTYREIPSFSKYAQAQTQDEKQVALQDMRRELDEDMTYVKTYHQAANTHEYMANAIGNAGSLVKFKNGIETLEGKSFGGKVKAVGHNAMSLLGLKSVSDAKTALGKAGIVVLDTGMVLISPFSLAVKGVYRYTPVIGKEAQKKRYEQKYDGKHSSPYEGRSDARKMIRRKEYKSEMSGPFKGMRAWIKATNDDLFRAERASETEQKVLDRHFEEDIAPSIKNRYVLGAKNADAQMKAKAKENIEMRKSAAREIASRDYTQGDLTAEAAKADNAVLNPRAIQGAALEMNGEDSETIRYSETYRPRETRFRKIRTALGSLHGDLDFSKIDFTNPEGSVVQTDAIDMASRQEAIDATTTARNYIPYALTGVLVGQAARYGISKLKTTIEEVIPGTTTKEQRIVGYEEYEAKVKIPKTKDVPDTSSVARTPQEFADAGNGANVHLHRSLWGGEKGGYDVDLTNYDSSAGFYVEVPKDNGGICRIALASAEKNGQYDYLGQLVTKYGLDQKTVAKYIDLSTGALKPDADLYNLAAEISNHMGATQGLTGDMLVEQVFNGQAKAGIELLKTAGGKNGGWVLVDDLQKTLGIKKVPDGFDIVTKIKKRPIWDWVEKTTPDQINIVEDETKKLIKKAGMKAANAASLLHVVEATEKAATGTTSKEPNKVETPDKVEPGRRQKDDDDLWVL